MAHILFVYGVTVPESKRLRGDDAIVHIPLGYVTGRLLAGLVVGTKEHHGNAAEVPGEARRIQGGSREFFTIEGEIPVRIRDKMRDVLEDERNRNTQEEDCSHWTTRLFAVAIEDYKEYVRLANTKLYGL